MEGSMEANGSVAFLYLIFQVLFQTVQTQTDSKTEETEEVFGWDNRWRWRNGGYVSCHHWKSSVDSRFNPDLAFPPLPIKNSGLLLGVNADYTHSHRLKKPPISASIRGDYGRGERNI